MTNDSRFANDVKSKLSWLVITKVLFLTMLVAVIYLLAEDMVGHRFFRGGWINHQYRLEP